ncbi:MAG: leucyl aminopeptidase [Acidobacteriota bacterium]
MASSYEIPHLEAGRAPAATTDVDLFIVPAFQDDPASGLGPFDKACGGELSAAVSRGEVTGKLAEMFGATVVDAGWKARRVLVVGAGPRKNFGVESARRLAAAAAIAARSQRRARVGLALGPEWSAAEQEGAAEGLTRANFDNGHYKTQGHDRFFLTAGLLVGPGADEAAVHRGRVVGEAVNAARVLINEPANELPPRLFVERAANLAAVPGVTADVLDDRRLAELGMGLLLGVGQGSVEPPRMLVLRYEPPGAPPGPVLALVGKGITFDTGGLSIKPADGMERMKDDMAGGATVASALRAIALLQAPLRVLAVIPSAENMPSGRALRPGDVLKSAAGLTVEVNNTDAEGRLILGDALWHARQLGATHLVDVATLTGACVVALGKITTGLFGTPAPWVDAVAAAGRRAGEKVWPMPTFDEYRESLKSEIADMLNSPGRPAGAITAAMFLREFVGTTPWAHLDIAGTAWADERSAWAPKGATGAIVSTLVQLARGGPGGWPDA